MYDVVYIDVVYKRLVYCTHSKKKKKASIVLFSLFPQTKNKRRIKKKKCPFLEKSFLFFNNSFDSPSNFIG